jgi:hypothetical protein
VSTHMEPDVQARLMEAAEREQERMSLTRELLDRDPTLGSMTAMIMAGDLLTAKTARQMVRDGEVTATQSCVFVGSYARLGYMVGLMDEGLLAPEWVYERLADEWSGSDPDDTNPRFLSLWRAAYAWNRSHYLTDRPEAVLPDTTTLRVYRGQDWAPEAILPGIAWSLDRTVAERFAKGAALRQSHRPGVVIEALALRKDVLGYMIGRKEAEVILDPADLILPTVRS